VKLKLEVSGNYEGRRETENTKEKELYIREIFHDVVAANKSGYLTVLFVGEKQRYPVVPSRSRLCINASLVASCLFPLLCHDPPAIMIVTSSFSIILKLTDAKIIRFYLARGCRIENVEVNTYGNKN